MTSSRYRGRPRRTRPHIWVRVVHAVLGGAAGIVWLMLPGMTTSADAPVAITREEQLAPPATTTAQEDDGTSAVDLVLPVAVLATVGALAAYGHVRRVRRARTRTTPGGTTTGAPPAPPPLTDLDAQARSALVEADDCVRASREELSFAEARCGPEAVAPFVRAVLEADGELSAAFRMRRRYDEGHPEEEAARLHALAGMVGRCREAGRRLELAAPAFRRLRDLEGNLTPALETAEARFRDLAGRTAAAEATLADLATRYSPAATASVTGYPEQAKDRLVFATTHLNHARQAADSGRPEEAARHLRAAEGAVAQATTFVEAVHELAAWLRQAADMVPAALTGAEAELSASRTAARAEGEPYARLLHADAELAAVRQELTSGRPHDPLNALRRIVHATVPLATGRTGVLPAAALLTAQAAVAAADDFIATHRGTVGVTARTGLAEAGRLLAAGSPADLPRADALGLEARERAELDVRLHGNPYPEAAGHERGTSGAVSGGILPGVAPDESPAGFGCP
ncbi:hypothetical protein [Streptomyces sp. NPDC052015]|uniref:hypothetical protein n=1 Tax=Streptomyces sp. NPDC052015 TaxID=3154755 RepID=UPI0034207C5B